MKITSEKIVSKKYIGKKMSYDATMVNQKFPSYIANDFIVHNSLHSGLTAQYVLRHNGKQEITYAHPLLKNITESTKGIIIYQEQIMKIMHDVGGLSWATSEMVRKAISKSMGKSIFDELKGQFVKHAVEKNGLKKEEAEDIFNATSMFGSYGYNKSHSYEYAIIAYWMAWLKYYHTKEFFCALLSRESDAEVEKQCIQDAKEFGIKVLPPEVNKSQESYIVDGDTIYCGLSSIKGLGPAAAKKILKERPFKHINRLAQTVAKNVLRALILSGSCDDFIPTRKWAMDNIDDLKRIGLPLEDEQEEYSEKESIMFQTEVLNFPYGKHPITFFDEEIKNLGDIKIHRIHDLKFEDYIDERWVRGIVTFINFKQEGLEGSWTMFDNVLERKYAHLNISDESGGNILVHVAPEQYTYYKKILERKKGIPLLIKAHSIINYQKLYCDALIVLDDIDYNNPIIKYIKENQRLDELKEILGKKGVIQTVTYKVSKNKKPYARLKLLDETGNTEDLMVFQLDRDIFVAGEIIVYGRYNKDTPFINVVRRIK